MLFLMKDSKIELIQMILSSNMELNINSHGHEG